MAPKLKHGRLRLVLQRSVFPSPEHDTIEANVVETYIGRPRDGLYEPALADTEREAVADLLQYLENVRLASCFVMHAIY